MTAREFATMLRGKRVGRGRYLARCPAHDDKNPSLTISDGKKGVVVYCWAGCTFDSILESVGLRKCDMFRDSMTPRERIASAAAFGSKLAPVTYLDTARRQARYGKGEVVAVYDYRNASGKLVAQKMRTNPKGFYWRHPDGMGGFIYKQPKDCPLYRLNEVVGARTVFVCEGEKDADSLAAILHSTAAATTAPNGAKDWKDEFRRWFSDKTVYVLPDNDEPGREYARRVVASLSGCARDVTVIHMPEGVKDVSDYLIAYGIDSLRGLIRAAMRDSKAA